MKKNSREGVPLVNFFYSRRLWFTVLILIVGLASVLLYSNWRILLSNWLDTLKYTFAIVGLISTLYNYWNKFNTFITRIKIILFNSSSKWSAQTSYKGEFDDSILNKVRAKLLQIEGSSSFNFVNNHMFTINIEGIHFQFDYIDREDDDGNEFGKLVCKIDDFYCSYDQSIKIFQNQLTPIFRMIEKETNSKDNLYTFKIKFKGKNPFLSLITKNVDTRKINSLWYNMDYDTKNGKKSVKVTDASIECTTNDITDFQNASINFISLVGD